MRTRSLHILFRSPSLSSRTCPTQTAPAPVAPASASKPRQAHISPQGLLANSSPIDLALGSSAPRLQELYFCEQKPMRTSAPRSSLGCICRNGFANKRLRARSQPVSGSYA